MEDTFLWMPRPNTIVVKDGKPVIDCNPTVGTLNVTCITAADVIFNLDGPDCYVDVLYAAQNSMLTTSIDGSSTKVLNFLPDPAEINKQDKVAYYHNMGWSPASNQLHFDGYVSVDIAYLPCVNDTLYIKDILECQALSCICSGTQQLCPQFEGVMTLTIDTTVTNSSQFEVQISGGYTIRPGEMISLPTVVKDEHVMFPGTGSVSSTIVI